MTQPIEIQHYNPQWERDFQLLRDVIEDRIRKNILTIEHVGSTSVKGLGAKPILDIDVVIHDYCVLPEVIRGLETLGYFHQDNWSFKGRESFGRKDPCVPWNGRSIIWMEHHLYVCDKDSKELAKHLAFRNYLRDHPEAVIEYERLKRELAKSSINRTAYNLGKTSFVEKIVEKAMRP